MHYTLRQLFAICCGVLLVAASANSREPAKPDAPVQGVTISGAPISEGSCEILASTNGQKPELREAPGLHVLDRTQSHPLSIAAIPDTKIIGVMCWRSEARLAPNDYLAGNAGFFLYIKTDTGNDATDRTLALEKINGSYRVRLLHGPDWTPAEEQEMVAAMTKFNKKGA